jgi:diguanylate cyclase (GGDEF)-like protein/PAS domain S-box-containing protein
MGNIISTRDVKIEGLDKSLYEIILDYSSDPIFCFSPSGRYLYINQAFSKAFNLMPSDIVGKLIWDVFPGEMGDMRFAAVKKALETKEETSIEVKVESVTGTIYFLTTVTPIMDDEGTARAAICISKNITKRKAMESDLNHAHELAQQKNQALDEAVKELYQKSITDLLTGLYNRQHSIDLLEKAIQGYDLRKAPLSLMFLDLDFFKAINDEYGHIEGDAVLKKFSSIMQSDFALIGDSGRYGGEEFIVVLPNVEAKEAAQMAEAFRHKIEKTAFTEKHIHLTTSIGVSQYAGEGTSKFIKQTDDAMYTAKANGRNRVEVYQP